MISLLTVYPLWLKGRWSSRGPLKQDLFFILFNGPQCDELSSTRGFSAGLTSLVVERRAASRKGVKRLSAQVIHIFFLVVAGDVGGSNAEVDGVPRLTLPTGGPAPRRQDRKVDLLAPRRAFHAAPCHRSSPALTAARALCTQAGASESSARERLPRRDTIRRHAVRISFPFWHGAISQRSVCKKAVCLWSHWRP